MAPNYNHHREEEVEGESNLISSSHHYKMMPQNADEDEVAPLVVNQNNNHCPSSSSSSSYYLLLLGQHHVHQHSVARHERSQLIVYLCLSLAYFGVVTTLFIANNRDQDYIEATYFLPFHYFEFWGALIFAMTEALLIYNTTTTRTTRTTTKKDDDDDVISQWAIVLVSINVITSAIACILFTLSPETFEVPSHLIEYSSQITVTLVDYIFVIRTGGRGMAMRTTMSTAAGVGQTIKRRQRLSSSSSFLTTTDDGNALDRTQLFQIVFTTCLFIMAILKLFLYTEVIPTRMGGERTSHYVEFIGEMLNSAFAIWFALTQYHRLNDEMYDHDAHIQRLIILSSSSSSMPRNATDHYYYQQQQQYGSTMTNNIHDGQGIDTIV